MVGLPCSRPYQAELYWTYSVYTADSYCSSSVMCGQGNISHNTKSNNLKLRKQEIIGTELYTDMYVIERCGHRASLIYKQLCNRSFWHYASFSSTGSFEILG